MTSGLAAPFVLRGVQEARISSVPAYASTSGDEAIRLGRLAGIELDPWQQVELRHGMGESPDWKCPECVYRSAAWAPCPTHPEASLLHPWAAFQVVDVDPRQNGKSEKLIVRMLAGLFVVEEMLQIYSAHLFDTAMEIFRRLVFAVENCDELRREVKHRGSKMVGIKYSHGEEGIELRDGRRIRFKARTGAGGRGFSGDVLYLDEGMILPESFLGATIPILSARPNPQIWLAASAPDEQEPTHDGVVLAKLRERAMDGDDPSLAYFEHSAEWDGDPGGVPVGVLADREQWALANPGLGIRISEDYIEKELRAMGARQFAIERLGIGAWPATSQDAARVIALAAWEACGEHDRSKRIASGWSISLDTNTDQTWGAVAIAGLRADGMDQAAVVRHARGTDWIVPLVVELLEAHPDAAVPVDKRGPAANLIPELEGAEIKPIELSTQEYGDACADLVKDATDGKFRYPFPQPELDAALAAARKQSMGDRWKWSRRASADASPLVAVTLARWGIGRGQEVPRDTWHMY